jgi:hypothetical protein
MIPGQLPFKTMRTNLQGQSDTAESSKVQTLTSQREPSGQKTAQVPRPQAYRPPGNHSSRSPKKIASNRHSVNDLTQDLDKLKEELKRISDRGGEQCRQLRDEC